jgi:hypothetical protein
VDDYKYFDITARANGYHWAGRAIDDFFCNPGQKYSIKVCENHKEMQFGKTGTDGQFNNFEHYPVVSKLLQALPFIQSADADTPKVNGVSSKETGEWLFMAVDSDESMEFQTMAFKHGYKWCGGGISASPIFGSHRIHVFPESKTLGWSSVKDTQTVPEKTLNKAKFWFEAQSAAPVESFWIFVVDAIASEVVQRIAFSHGYAWGTGSKEYFDASHSWLKFYPDSKLIIVDKTVFGEVPGRVIDVNGGLADWIKIFNNPPKAPPISYCFNNQITLHGDGRLETKGNCILSRERVQELFNQWSNI